MARKREVIEAELVEDETALAVRRPTSPARRRAGDPFDELYNSFLADKSEITRRNYRIDLRHFAQFLGSGNEADAFRELCSMSGPDANATVYRYRTTLRQSYSAATINRRLAAVRSITKLARLFGLVDWRIEIEGERSRAFRDTAGCGYEGLLELVATIEREIAGNAALDRPHQARKRWRDRALLYLMFHAGLRRMEPLTARYPQDLRMSKHDGMPEMQIIGKKRNGQREWVQIGKTAYAAVMDWVQYRGEYEGPLFPGRSGTTSLDESCVNDLISRLAAAANVDVTPHGLRHTAITEVLERTNDVRVAQRFARHSSPATTMVYDDNRDRVAARGVAALERDDDDPVSPSSPKDPTPSTRKRAKKKAPPRTNARTK